MKVDALDLRSQYQAIKKEIDITIQQVIESGRFILGENLTALENEIAEYCGSRFGIGVASGTDALHLALISCGVQPGDEVITTAFSFIATAEVILYCRCVPVFVDIDPETFNIDPQKIREKITEKTKVIIPVHLYGQPADMDSICKIAREFNLKIIEDAAQAFGSEYRGAKIGTIGDAGCFSFFPTKNLGCYGDGGMVVTDDERIAEDIRKRRVHGSEKRNVHEILGYNSRLDEIQAAVLRVKLRHIDRWNEMRRERAFFYNECLSDTSVRTPHIQDDTKHVFHLYTLKIKDRDNCLHHLKKCGIDAGVYYPYSIPSQPVIQQLGYNHEEFFECNSATREVLSVPVYPEVGMDKIEYIAEKIKEFHSLSDKK